MADTEQKEKVTRRGILGGLLAGVIGVFVGKRKSTEPEVLWEEPEEETEEPTEDDEEESSVSLASSGCEYIAPAVCYECPVWAALTTPLCVCGLSPVPHSHTTRCARVMTCPKIPQSHVDDCKRWYGLG